MYCTTVWESHPERAELPGVEVSGHVHKAKFVRKNQFSNTARKNILKKRTGKFKYRKEHRDFRYSLVGQK